jgi:chromosome segregation ATPase
MTNSGDRLDRLEAIVESNSRAIQALLDAQASDRLQRAELQSAITDINEAIQRLTTLNEGVVNLLSSLDSDRPTILSKLNKIENKVDRLLSQGNGGQPQP